MISADELAEMRTNADGTLPDVCDILRVVSVSDGQGGGTMSWSPVHADVPCSVAPTQVHDWERPVASRVSSQSGWTITVPAGTDVKVTDRVQVGVRLFDVAKVSGPRSWEIDRQVYCSETT